MANYINMLRWVHGLASGRFLQGRGLLCATYPGQRRYCCLGVACELALADNVPLKIVDTKHCRTYDSASAALPPAVTQWLGLDYAAMTGDVLFAGDPSSAIRANDQAHLPFTEIAELIRATYLQGHQ